MSTTESPEQRRARIHADVLASFESSVRYHFANPPESWTVRKAAERRWHVVNAAGDVVDSFTTRKDAEAELARDGDRYGRIWRDRDAWYRGTSTDPRNRALSGEEQRIVRLEYLRQEIRAERISYGEIAELQSLAPHIDPSDVELLEWAGVPEHE